MARVKGPLLSMRASGSIAKTQTYASWRGIPYVRELVVPANPQTVAQMLTRNVFSWLNDLFRHFGPYGLAPWAASAQGRAFTDRNSCIKSNIPILRSAVTLADLVGSPGVRGGPALATFTPNPGVASGSIDFDFTLGTLPTGWSLARVAGFGVVEADPHDLDPIGYAEGTYVGANPQTFTITGLTAGSDYACVGWAVYIRDDGTLAYSPSVSLIVTATP
ncbi:MAG: hypothetical protein WAP47_09260 [Candidatus Rokuibacteriota bacterium]